MKNKIEFKKYLVIAFVVPLIILFVFILIHLYEYKIYTENFNHKINSIVNVLQSKYPNIKENEIVEIFNSESKNKSELLEKYAIDLNDKAIVIENEETYKKFLIINSIFILTSCAILTLFFIKYINKREKNIVEITKYIEQLNRKNYELKIDSNTEDELSILKNEIYKTTIMLKEAAENSNKDKINLKKSLEDISHQLKTPITSILIMLDDLIDDQNMSEETREEFIRDIKRDIININFLVQSLLKLSKFDANTIKFVKKEILLENIVNEAVKNVSTLCDLKNIKLNINGNSDAKVMCDYMWQVEALTNIIKNCVEHSYNDSKIDIFYEQNKIYSIITIRDYGDGIDKNEISHIFERFYKGKNSSSESVGIGLSLAKTIVENDNGVINVKSDESGTKFSVKYFNI